MSKPLVKSSGGLNPNQKNIGVHANSTSTNYNSPVPTNSIYRSKLRPRPTKQTELFASPTTSNKRQRLSLLKGASQENKRSNSNLKNRTPDKKSLATDSNKNTTNLGTKKIKPEKRKIKASANKALAGPPKLRKLASSLPSSEDLSKSETSVDLQSSSSISDRGSHSAKLKASSSKAKLPQKSKSDTSILKSPSLVTRKGKVRKWQEKYLSSKNSGSSNTSKTGSCVSSRRGSERGKASSAVARSRSSSLRATAAEEPCSDDSLGATSSHRQSRGARGAKTIPQSDNQNTNNETASTSRSTSRTNGTIKI